MDKFLLFLSGKKTVIASIIGLLLVFGIGRKVIPQDVAELISGIMTILGLTASVATAKMYKRLR